MRWQDGALRLMGGSFPRSYLTFDVETSGFSFEIDVITEFGAVRVRDGKPVEKIEVIINWTGREVPPHNWLCTRLEDLARKLRADGKSLSTNIARMRSQGVPAEEGLKRILAIFAQASADKIPVCAHHGYGFDERMLETNFTGFSIADSFSFGDSRLIDTEALEKALEGQTQRDMTPRSGETLRVWCKRMIGQRLKCIYSNLDTHCFTKYRWRERHNADPGNCHNALFDALLVHYLMEDLRPQYEQIISAAAHPLAPSGPSPPRPARPIVYHQRNR
jgi:hypothetical protein